MLLTLVNRGLYHVTLPAMHGSDYGTLLWRSIASEERRPILQILVHRKMLCFDLGLLEYCDPANLAWHPTFEIVSLEVFYVV